MKRLVFVFVAIGSILASPASAADGLECLEAPLSVVAQAYVDDYRDSFDIDLVQNPSVTAEIAQVMRERLSQCREQHGWSEDSFHHAAYYLGPWILVDVIRSKIPLGEEQLDQFDARYAEADKARLRSGLTGANQADGAYVVEIAALDGVEDRYEMGAWLGALLVVMVERDRHRDAFLAS